MGTIWHNGMIYTLSKEGETVEAVYTHNGKIIETGVYSYLKETYERHISKEIDVKGMTMIPGLVDSHLHLVGHGERLMRLDLSFMESREAVLEAVRRKCESVPPGHWVIAEGWNENEWQEPDLILRDDLDRISIEHPIVLKRVCRHALVVNSRALKKAGVTEEVMEPAGAVISRYDDGRLNGLFKEQQALNLILDHLPDIDRVYVEKALEIAIKDAHRLGLTGGHTEDLHYYNGFLPVYQAFQSVIETAGLRFRAHLLVHHEAFDEMLEYGGRYGGGTEYVTFDAVKIFSDGSLGGRTALLSKPYKDDPSVNGVAVFSEEELQKIIVKARKAEMPVAIHAIGDLACEYVLNGLEKHPPKRGQRDRLIHAQIMRPDLIKRARDLPLIFDIQPGFVPSDFPWVEDKVDEELLDSSYAWKTYLDNGIICAGGSDAPIESLNPFLGIHAAVTRRNPFEKNGTSYGAKETLTVYEAVSLYTKGSAAAIIHESDRGQLKKGFDADFTIISRDIFRGTPDEILEAEAVMTVIGEEIVFAKASCEQKDGGNSKKAL
ncbi:amidohydrolase [Bacillus massiliglaciei]|uniref:amidohydrolase n=1 Tax=Bacillus massiliglaciei TaxID=1816693 RepID=UPI000A7981B0|nr:amidohydrolase [Bacillus massiliglaciei]